MGGDMTRWMKWAAPGVALLLATMATGPRPAGAAGALAVAKPENIVADGYSYGTAFNYDTEDEARTTALERCRSSTKSEKRRALCKVIVIFKGQCVAVAMDPKDGTPGVGWSVAETRNTAEHQALTNCQDTAGADRRDACRVDKGVGCDTKW
jgi:hypothetical protein